MGLMQKVFGDLNSKEVKKLEKIADQVMALEEQMESLSDEELKAKTGEFKERLAAGETLDDLCLKLSRCAGRCLEKRGSEAFQSTGYRRYRSSSGQDFRDEDR